MSARRLDGGAVYAAADSWIESALRSDDSLFTPGTPIWSERWLGEARDLFLDRPHVWKGKDFFERGLPAVLAGNPPEFHQLMGEALYVAYLIIYKDAVGQAKKIERVNQVLGRSCKPVEFPDYLHAGVENGIMSPGSFINYGDRLAVVVEFVERWKKNGSDVSLLNRDSLDAPWRFQEFVADFTTPARRVPLLHLVHPDYFEAMAVSHMRSVAKAQNFQHFANKSVKDVDRRIYRIRAALEPKYGEGFDFFKHEIRLLWDDEYNPGAKQ